MDLFDSARTQRARKAKKKTAKKARRPAGRRRRKKAPAGSKASTAAAVLDVIQSTVYGKQKELDPGNALLLSDPDILSDVTEWIPTGIPSLDKMIGGGWPVGRMVEVFGPEGSGKSALTHIGIKQCQMQGPEAYAATYDYEGALEKPKLIQIGIDPNRLLYFWPDDGEEGWDILHSILKTAEKNPPKYPLLVVWDSIAATPSRHEKKQESFGDNDQPGGTARLFSKGLRRLQKLVARTRCCLIFVNQERDNIRAKGPFKESITPGGRAVKFYASLRVRTTRVSTLKRGGLASGYLIQCLTRKCRLAPPHRKTTWVLDFKYGPSPELSMFDALRKAGKIKKSGNGYAGTWWHGAMKNPITCSLKPDEDPKWLQFMQEPTWREGVEAATRELAIRVDARAKAADDTEEN